MSEKKLPKLWFVEAALEQAHLEPSSNEQTAWRSLLYEGKPVGDVSTEVAKCRRSQSSAVVLVNEANDQKYGD